MHPGLPSAGSGRSIALQRRADDGVTARYLAHQKIKHTYLLIKANCASHPMWKMYTIDLEIFPLEIIRVKIYIYFRDSFNQRNFINGWRLQNWRVSGAFLVLSLLPGIRRARYHWLEDETSIILLLIESESLTVIQWLFTIYMLWDGQDILCGYFLHLISLYI